MSFCDITIAQRNANYTNIADTAAETGVLLSDVLSKSIERNRQLANPASLALSA